MARKKADPAKTFKADPGPVEVEPVAGPLVDEALILKLASLKGMTREIAEHMIEFGVINDVYVLQTQYRIPGATAAEIIELVHG